MTDNIHRCLVVPVAFAEQARDLCAQLAGPPGEGMFVTALQRNPVGRVVGISDDYQPVYENSPPPADGSITHYISAGQIAEEFAAVLADPQVMAGACAAHDPPIDAPLELCTALLAASDISEDEPFTALARLGLQLMPPPEDPNA